ncbi:aminotransferase class IV [Kibdelosporangium persicum]|uniref:Branched-chain amino acid aminotransferase n=1 Tax=Kibdelosporangium persicum TaxID=2698649 RepID=A0ABX2EZP6_9PSEU|nr:aminotransferase class IV [Kibdelosporangium persicum]NRN64250.1 Branched-chain amino acid aminotransferase [Kibdelosporangium persicum]
MEDLETIAFVNYGHFTSMAVYPDGVRGLELHLERLDRDARIVFGHGIDGGMVRERVHAAVQGHELPANVRVTVFTRNVSADRLVGLDQPDVMVKVRPMRVGQPTPPRVRSSVFGRYLPEVKHVGTFSLFHEVRLAQQAGYDDVLFVDEDGRVSEGSVWNVGFHDGERIIWPDAPALPGVEMTLLRRGLRAIGVPDERREVRLSDLGAFRGAFRSNAIGGPTPLASIDDVTFAPDPDLAGLLARARQAVPREPLLP